MTPESSAFLQIWQITDLTRWSDSVPNDPLMSSESIWYEKYQVSVSCYVLINSGLFARAPSSSL